MVSYIPNGFSRACQAQNARKEYYLAGTQILSVSLSQSSLHTHTPNKIKRLQMDRAKMGMRKRSPPLSLSFPLSLPDCLNFQPPLSRDAETLVSPSYCYEFSIVISRLHF